VVAGFVPLFNPELCHNDRPPPFLVAAGSRAMAKPKNKLAAALLAIFLGGFGIHKFYLGKIGMGILYLVFCWTGVPEIIGIIEGILMLLMSDEAFNAKYNQ
jgi:TM2 domain-containing membrane protein YozV